MKAVLLLPLALALQIAAPDGPATTPDLQYPVHLQIMMTKANGSFRGFSGFGRGNILGPPLQGVDFTYNCSTPMLDNGRNEFYQARWKKQDRKLEILMQRIGSDHVDKCDLEVALKNVPYGHH